RSVRAGGVLIRGIDIRLPPACAAVGGEMRVAKIGEAGAVGVIWRNFKSQRDFAKAPVAIAAGALPASCDILVAGLVGDVAPVRAAVGGSCDRRFSGGASAGDVCDGGVVARH